MGKVMKKFAAGKSSSMIKKKDFVKQMNSGSKYGVSVITDITHGDLNAFGSYDVNVIVTSLTWGEYRDKLIIELDDMEPIIVDLIINSKSAPITWATKSVMFGGVPASSKANKKMPLTNVGMVKPTYLNCSYNTVVSVYYMVHKENKTTFERHIQFLLTYIF